MNPKCPERERLVKEYAATVNAYGRAVKASRGRSAGRAVRQKTQETSELCQQALKAVLDHEKQHGCGTGSAPKAENGGAVI